MDALHIMSEPEIGFRAPLPEELAPLFPKYQILSLLATGGMGAVYHAVQTALEREVAIKILPVEFGNDPEFREGFGAEAKAMAKLNHPNLIGVYDYGDVDGMLFIVMEYVPGQSLHDACAGHAIDPAEVVRLITGICHGLAHAHAQGIVHRDIKPANILLDSQLQPKIGDFGLARPLDKKTGEGEAIYGTPGYTAPEVLDAPHMMDQRADVFSLGVLLHELLTGFLPSRDPRSPSAISHCDSRFDAVVRKATHPDPHLRYQNASEIAGELQKISSPAARNAMRAAPSAAPRKPAARVRPTRVTAKEGGGFGGMVLPLAAVAALVCYYYKDPIRRMLNLAPTQVQLVELKPEPEKPKKSAADPESAKSEPEPLASVPEPVKPGPEPTVSAPEPVMPEPEPLASSAGAGSGASPTVTTPQPKFDVDGFLSNARSVMLTRCTPDIAKHDQALENNLAAFKREGMGLAQTNIGANHHQALGKEIDAYLATCKANGNRLADKLDAPLKFKKWLVELHEERKAMEKEIDERLIRALTGQKTTYLHGLGLRINALRKDDPVAADLIKVELDKVNTSQVYFADMMVEAASKK